MKNSTIVFATVLIIIIIIIIAYTFMKKEKYNITIENLPMQEESQFKYGISRSRDMVVSISGFKPNSWVIFSVNDLRMNFPVDEKGFMYWNKEKESLPVYLLPYVDMRVTNINGPTDMDNSYTEIDSKPVQQCYNIPEKDRKTIRDKIEIKVDLVYQDRNSGEIKTTSRTVIIEGGAMSLDLKSK